MGLSAQWVRPGLTAGSIPVPGKKKPTRLERSQAAGQDVPDSKSASTAGYPDILVIGQEHRKKTSIDQKSHWMAPAIRTPKSCLHYL
jgi:hypothetical protein